MINVSIALERFYLPGDRKLPMSGGICFKSNGWGIFFLVCWRLSLFPCSLFTLLGFIFTGHDSSTGLNSSRGRTGCQRFDIQPRHFKGVKNGTSGYLA